MRGEGGAIFFAETLVFTLIVLLLLFWVVLTVLLAAWSLWFQASIYTESTSGIFWRGPAAGAAITAVALLWVVLDYRSPERFRPLWEVSSTEKVKQYPELRVLDGKGKELVYKLQQPGNIYRLPGGKALTGTPPAIVVIEGDDRYTFEPERDAERNFKRRKVPGGRSEDPLIYRDQKGRVMVEGSLGQIETFRGGMFLANVLLNLALVAACFLALWLLLGFQWPHALGQAVVLALLLLLFVMPQLLKRVEDVARERAAASRSSSS
jgi:hypothetical protein